jgi:hypothetical protein
MVHPLVRARHHHVAYWEVWPDRHVSHSTAQQELQNLVLRFLVVTTLAAPQHPQCTSPLGWDERPTEIGPKPNFPYDARMLSI